MDKTFIMIPVSVLKMGLHPHAYMVYSALVMRADNETGICYPGKSKISEDTSLSVSAVKRALKLLEDSGLVTVKRRPNGGKHDTNVYTIQNVGSNGTYVPDPTLGSNGTTNYIHITRKNTTDANAPENIQENREGLQTTSPESPEPVQDKERDSDEPTPAIFQAGDKAYWLHDSKYIPGVVVKLTAKQITVLVSSGDGKPIEKSMDRSKLIPRTTSHAVDTLYGDWLATAETRNAAIASLMGAWHDAEKARGGNPERKQFQNRDSRREAWELWQAGIRPEHIAAFVPWQATDAFWKTKPITWNRVVINVGLYVRTHYKPAVTTPHYTYCEKCQDMQGWVELPNRNVRLCECQYAQGRTR